MSTTEEQVRTETPQTQTPANTGKNAFAAARASIKADSKEPPSTETPATAEDTPSTETPVEESEKVADQPQETADETDHLLTTEEVSQLTPKERERYKRLDQAWTQKTQKLAAERKEMESWKPLIDALQTDPGAAIEHVAKQLGFTVSKAQPDKVAADTVKETTSDTMAALPEEWRFLAPVFEQFGKTILASVEGKLKPIAETQTRMISEAVAAETNATIEAFSASHKDWRKYEAQMMDIGKKIVPTAGSMTDLEYMELLYKLASIKDSDADKTKKVVEKINKSAATSETRTSGLSTDRIEQVLPPAGKRDIRAAYEAAKRGEVWTK